MDVILEVGKKKTFANAVEWPGYGRSGRDEAGALQALLAHGQRYGRAIGAANLDFSPPQDRGDLAVIKRLEGNASTDFGAFSVIPEEDMRPVGEDELQRLQVLLRACWDALDEAAAAALGKELVKGPRGGGRELDGILQHVLGSETSYLGRIGVKFKAEPENAIKDELHRCEQAMLDGLAASARGELPTQGPRGGVYWPLRYLVRTAAWHVLDHAWEIEDRVISI